MVAKAKISSAVSRVQPDEVKEPGREPRAPSAKVLEKAVEAVPHNGGVVPPMPIIRTSKISKTLALRMFQTIDLGILLAAAMYAFATLSPMGLAEVPFAIALPFVLMPVLFAGALAFTGIYFFDHQETLLTHWGKTLAGLALGVVLTLACAGLAGIPALDMTVMFMTMAVAGVAILSLHANYMALVDRWHKNGALTTNVVIVGATPNAQELIRKNSETGELSVAGIFEDRNDRTPRAIGDVPVLGTTQDLLNWEHLPKIDRIIITVTSTATHRVRQLIDKLRGLPQDVVLFMDMDHFNPGATTLAEIAHAPMAYVSGTPRDDTRATAKRVQDVVIGLGLLVMFAPVMALVALAIKMDSKGPVLFRQKRHGFNNQIIEILKFRSMHVHEANGPMQQVEGNDCRVTRVGRFIRLTSLDELPQLFNVLGGSMSLVGPRPHAVDMHTGDVESHLLVAEYAHRHRVKPGLTGWAQVNGSRGPLHTAEDVRERVRLDVEYVDRGNFWLDLWIMLKTAPVLLGDSTNIR